jgi:hypothetical protein
MKTASQILAELGIHERRGLAAYATVCPQCSAERRKKREKCLSVSIDQRGVRWNCHHCQWQGAEFYDEPRRPDAASKPVDSADDIRERNKRFAHQLWRESILLPGTLGEHYFLEHRKIDIRGLELDHALRWHPGERMIVALMTDPVTNEPLGIHRTFLNRDGTKLDRKMLGPSGVVRLWPDEAVTTSLVLGEGVETTLAAAIHVEHRGALLRPAWAAGSASAVAKFPVLTAIETLTVLIDNDAGKAGENAGVECADRYRKARRRVVLLIPPAKDFNELVKGSTP